MKYIIIDTNIFARFFVRDVISQYEEAKKIFNQIEGRKLEGRASILVLDELIWVLESYYELERNLFIPQIMQILSLRGMKIIEAKKNIVMRILEKMKNTNLDFTDLYLMQIAGSEEIVSFDKALRNTLKK